MLKFSCFYVLGLFFFESYILYVVELYLKLTPYQLILKLSSIYPKYLYSEPTILQVTSVDVSVQNETPTHRVV